MYSSFEGIQITEFPFYNIYCHYKNRNNKTCICKCFVNFHSYWIDYKIKPRIPYIKNIYSRSGIVKGEKRNESEDVIGSIKIELIDWKKRPQAKYVIEELKQSTKKFPGIYIEFIEKQDGPPKDKDVEIEIVNNNAKKLFIDTSVLYTFLKKKSWVQNIDTDLNIPGVEWELSIDRVKAEKQGVDIEMISN